MLAILTTHPIQYQVPLWRALAARGQVPFRVLYMSDRGLAARFDPGFGRAIAWDIDLTSDYPHEFLDVERGSSEEAFLGLKLKPGFGRKLQREGYRAMWIQGWQTAAYWQAVWMARSAGLEVWLRGETNLRSNASGGRMRIAKRLLLGELLRRVDRYLYIGSANRAFYLARGIALDRLSPAPYGVDNARFAHSAATLKPERLALRSAFGIDPDAFCFLFVGKLQPKKRPQDLLTAVRDLRTRLPGNKRVQVLLIGTGELEAALRASSPDEVFVGFLNQSEIAKAYVAADCLVLPSDAQETWGLVVNEAMASGLQAIVSDACGCAEDLVAPIRPDFVFPVGDTHALSCALERAVVGPLPLHQIERHIDGFDPLRTVETVERLYAELFRRTATVADRDSA